MRSIKLTKILCVIYILLLIWIIFLKMYPLYSGMLVMGIRNLNLIPFAESRITGAGGIDVLELVYNIGIFIPLGIFLKVLGREVTYKQALLAIIVIAIGVETIQFILGIGASDITDIITNTTGGCIGLAIYALLERKFGNKSHVIINYLVVATLVLLVIAITGYAFYLKVIL